VELSNNGKRLGIENFRCLNSSETDIQKVSMPNFRDWQKEGKKVFDGLSVYTLKGFSLEQKGREEEWVFGAEVSPNYFSVFKVFPKLGRSFKRDEVSSSHVVVLSEHLFKRFFPSAAQVSDCFIRLDGESYTIIGVMPDDFAFPEPKIEVWLPLETNLLTAQNRERGSHAYDVVGRLGQNVTLLQAQSAMNVVANHLSRQYPNEQSGRGVTMIPLQEDMVGNLGATLWLLQSAAVSIFLIVCFNLASLFVSRAMTREKDLFTMIALGARRRDVIQQLLGESLWLSIGSVLVGLLISLWGLEFFKWVGDSYHWVRVREIRFDVATFAMVSGFAVMVILCCNLVAAWKTLKVQDVQFALRGVETGAAGPRQYLRKGLVVAEVACSLVVLSSVGLLLRSFLNVEQNRSGILEPEKILTASVTLPKNRYLSLETMENAFQLTPFPNYNDGSSRPGIRPTVVDVAKHVPGKNAMLFMT
jgi:putative ABC transport system permease protein